MRGIFSKSILLHIVAKVCLMTNPKSNPFTMPYISLANTLHITRWHFVED